METPSDARLSASVLAIASKVFYSDGPIDFDSRLSHDLIATPVDISDICRHIGRRLNIEITRDEILVAMKSNPHECTLGWLVEQCRRRQASTHLGR